ncbi:MAG: adenine methylase [Sphingomonadales bacterium]|nr:adenine methylase [Sphingomonadales bacterium]
MDDAAHAELLAFLHTLQGMIVLSGYPSPIYDQALPEWRRVEKEALADGARPRIEILWINPAAADALADARQRREAGPLFEVAA